MLLTRPHPPQRAHCHVVGVSSGETSRRPPSTLLLHREPVQAGERWYGPGSQMRECPAQRYRTGRRGAGCQVARRRITEGRRFKSCPRQLVGLGRMSRPCSKCRQLPRRGRESSSSPITTSSRPGRTKSLSPRVASTASCTSCRPGATGDAPRWQLGPGHLRKPSAPTAHDWGLSSGE